MAPHHFLQNKTASLTLQVNHAGAERPQALSRGGLVDLVASRFVIENGLAGQLGLMLGQPVFLKLTVRIPVLASSLLSFSSKSEHGGLLEYKAILRSVRGCQ